MQIKNTISTLLISSALVVPTLSSAVTSLPPINPHREVVLAATDVQEGSNYAIPLSKMQRADRSWSPEKVLNIESQSTRHTFKIARSADLAGVIRFYSNQIMNEKNKVIFECEGRSCGSSNAWANNFFNDYRLYGRDDNQVLKVLQNNEFYTVMYINRRGAGDVMVRVDQIIPMSEFNKDPAFKKQISVNDIAKIRLYIEDQPSDVHYYLAVTASGETTGEAFNNASQNIQNLTLSLGPRLLENMEFVNLGNSGLEVYGEDQLTFIEK